MSSGDTARQAPDVEGLLRAWLQTQECKERGLHLLRADDFQGVCDGHLVEARLKAAKALKQEININHPAPPRERKGAAERSNRFLRGASPGTGRARLEIARRRREATLLVEQLHKCNKIGLGAASAARPACPTASESPSSITGACEQLDAGATFPWPLSALSRESPFIMSRAQGGGERERVIYSRGKPSTCG